MELQDYLNVVRKRWRIIAFVALVVIGLSAALTMVSTRVYAARTQFFVSTSGGDNAASLQQGNTFTQQRVKSYSQLLQSPKVLEPVVEQLGLAVSPGQLAGHVTATVPLDTVIIEVTVTDSSPQGAAKVAQAIGEVFPRTIEEIERVQPGQASPVKVTVVREAEADAVPISPQPARNIALGLVLGLIAGFGVALLRDVLDQTVKAQRDLEGVTDRTVIGGIAFDGDASDHPLIVQVDPRSQRAEAFRSLRTNLQFVDVANPPRSIVITSSLPGEGKSTTAANLALSLAETGLKVVVIEGDLRRPRLLEYLGFEGSVGLTDVLVGRVGVDDVLQQFGRTNLFILGAGPIPPNPSELLGSANMEALVAELVARFDYVLIDAPPLLPVTDSAVLSTVVDGALVIVGAGVVTKDQLGHAIESLDAVNGTVLGLILNRVQPKDGGSYGTYRYEYQPESERQRARRRGLGLSRLRGVRGGSSSGAGVAAAAVSAVAAASHASPRPVASEPTAAADTDVHPVPHVAPHEAAQESDPFYDAFDTPFDQRFADDVAAQRADATDAAAGFHADADPLGGVGEPADADDPSDRSSTRIW